MERALVAGKREVVRGWSLPEPARLEGAGRGSWLVAARTCALGGERAVVRGWALPEASAVRGS